MLNKAVITQFLKRKLASYEWLKDETARDLGHALKALNPPLDPKDLWAHQRALLLIILELQRFMLHIEMGGGKTRICLEVLSYRKQRGDKLRAIVFVPYLTSVSTWIEQTQEHTSHLICVPLQGNTSENLDTLQNTQGDLFVIAYASAVAMLSGKRRTKRGKTEWFIDTALLEDTFQNFDTIICDEVHKCKGYNTLTYEMCRAISARCDWALGLTGTPFNKDPSDLWAQFNLIDFGETLGPNISFFRAVFFKQEFKRFGRRQIPEWTFKKALLPALQKAIQHKSISYGIQDLLDMPPRNFIQKSLKAVEGQKEYAKAAIKKIQQASGDYQVIESNYLQLRQLSSGFMTLKGQNNDRIQVSFDENPKLEALIELIENMPSDRKMVCFHHFIFSNKLISERLTKLGVGHARIWSGTKDPLKELQRFKDDPDCRVLVINDQIGSSSLNLQHANYLVFYEQPDSAITRQQAERRVWRPGQQRRVFVYDLFVEGTYDRAMHTSNKAGESLLQKLLRGEHY